MHEKVPLRMLAEFGRHAADHAQIIRHATDLREQIAYLESRLPVALEVPVRGLDRTIVIELRLLHVTRHGPAPELFEHRFVIKGIDMRHPATHVEKNHRSCLWRETLRTMHERGLCVFLY